VCLQLYNEELFDLLDVTKDPTEKVSISATVYKSKSYKSVAHICDFV